MKKLLLTLIVSFFMTSCATYYKTPEVVQAYNINVQKIKNTNLLIKRKFIQKKKIYTDLIKKVYSKKMKPYPQMKNKLNHMYNLIIEIDKKYLAFLKLRYEIYIILKKNKKLSSRSHEWKLFNVKNTKFKKLFKSYLKNVNKFINVHNSYEKLVENNKIVKIHKKYILRSIVRFNVSLNNSIITLRKQLSEIKTNKILIEKMIKILDKADFINYITNIQLIIFKIATYNKKTIYWIGPGMVEHHLLLEILNNRNKIMVLNKEYQKLMRQFLDIKKCKKGNCT